MLVRNQITQLITHGRVETTLPKARHLAKATDRVISMARRSLIARASGDVRRAMKNYKQANEVLMPSSSRHWGKEKVATKTVFEEHAARYATRHDGGYTRILRTRKRQGDGASMAYVELVARPGELRPARGCTESILEYRHHEYGEPKDIEKAPLVVRQAAHQTLPPEWARPEWDFSEALKERRITKQGKALARLRKRHEWLDEAFAADDAAAQRGGSGGGEATAAAARVQKWRCEYSTDMRRILWGA